MTPGKRDKDDRPCAHQPISESQFPPVSYKYERLPSKYRLSEVFEWLGMGLQKEVIDPATLCLIRTQGMSRTAQPPIE